MATALEKIEFLAQLGGVALADAKTRKRREQREQVTRDLLGEGLSMSVRDELRTAMTFEVELDERKGEKEGKVKSMDEGGQRTSIESEDASSRYRSIRKEDYLKVQAALEKIIAIKERMLAMKDEQGEPLFDKADLMTELFTPLVREGLMPENLVIDDYSETAQLLKNTYKSYLGMLEDSREERLKKQAKAKIDIEGGSTGKDMVKAGLSRFKLFVDQQIEPWAESWGLTVDEYKRAAKIGYQASRFVLLAKKMPGAVTGLQDIANGETANPRAPTEENIAKLSKKTAVKLVTGVRGLVKAGIKLHGALKKGEKAQLKAELGKATEDAARRIDAHLAKGLAVAAPAAAGSFDGRFEASLSSGEMFDAVKTSKQAGAVVAAIGKALDKSLGGMLQKPDSAVAALQKAALNIRAALSKDGQLANGFQAGLNFETHRPAEIFEPFVLAVCNAADKEFENLDLRNALGQAGSDLKQAALLNREMVKQLQEELKVDDRVEKTHEDDEPPEEDDLPMAEALVTRAAFEAVIRIDQTVADAFYLACGHAPGALEGHIAAAIKPKKMAEAALAGPADAEAVVKLMGEAFTQALGTLLSQPEAASQALKAAATRLVETYAKVVDRAAFDKAAESLDESLDPLFECFVEAAAPAAKAAFEDPGFAKAMQEAKAPLEEVARANNTYLVELQDALEEETEEFERQLVLIDDTGEEMARQHSIGLLIAQLKEDQANLAIVNKVGALLGGFGGSTTQLGVTGSNFDSGTVVDTVASEVGQSLVPALKAAQLVMQMSVNIIQIANRAQLAAKFEKDVEKARKAGTPLLPAIENFYDAKQMQQTLAQVELALQAVQLAGAICSSVPEPITQGVGRLLFAVGRLAAAGKKVGQSVYQYQELAKGWQITLEALNNPANRRAGLDALRINGTLAVHAVAWAAMENDDPIAREILRSCGVEAQTLADNQADQDTVIQYLETRLYEDLKFKDRQKIDTHWVPQPLELSYPAWFALLNRARTKATPKLNDAPTKEVDLRMRQLGVQPAPEAIMKDLKAYPPDQLKAWQEEARGLVTALQQYQPMTPDNMKHKEMKDVRDRLVDLAGQRARAIGKALSERQKQPVEPPPQLQEQPQEQPPEDQTVPTRRRSSNSNNPPPMKKTTEN